MKEFIKIYNQHIKEIEEFLVTTVHNFGSLSNMEEANFKDLYHTFDSLELVYACDGESLNQLSDSVFRRKINRNHKGKNRSYLMNKMVFDQNDIAISRPYVSSATRHSCLTVVKVENGRLYFLDFSLTDLLTKLNLLHHHKQFNIVNQTFYLLTSALMIMLSLFAIADSLYEFFKVLLNDKYAVESIFRPVIALTLGLAIFDLGKTIMEQEVIFKNYDKNDRVEYRILTKFSITIIIALLIEALVMVFKVAISDYENIHVTLYLISGISMLIVALAIFIFLTNKSSNKQ